MSVYDISQIVSSSSITTATVTATQIINSGYSSDLIIGLSSGLGGTGLLVIVGGWFWVSKLKKWLSNASVQQH